jgi:hypothetical protein
VLRSGCWRRGCCSAQHRSTAEYLAQWRTLRAENAQLEQRLARLTTQEQRDLETELQRVQTDLGREALARQRGWLRKGEEPLRINRP